MNVNIVLSDYQSDLILPRLARCLSETAGWPMATRPNPKADANLFLVYIDYAESNSTCRRCGYLAGRSMEAPS